MGHVELKRPDTSVNPDTFDKRNKEQWRKLRNLPNLLYTNGTEWWLFSYGEVIDSLTIHLDAKNKPENIANFGRLIHKFLSWAPTPIVSADALVEKMGMLAALLREEILVQLREQRRIEKSNKRVALADLPLVGLKQDWRSVLYPRATDEEFADGFAQTVIFALVLALTEDMKVSVESLHQISQGLKANHGLLGSALGLLTEHIASSSPLFRTLTVITRTFEAVAWDSISKGKEDVYLHLYEHFLSVYDPELRKKTGSYYTPVEVVESMVRITDDALRTYLGKELGLASDGVAVIDPAMGTGTYPLAVLRSVANNPDLLGPGDRADKVSQVAENLYGFELQSGSFSVAELRISQTVQQLGGKLPENGLNLFVTDTLEDPASTSKQKLSYNLQLIAEQRVRANQVKAETPIQVCIGNPPYKDKSEGLGGWIEQGSNGSLAPLADFKAAGNGRLEYVLKNLYVYFWRWAFWKVFESVEDSAAGVVCFITADGYLRGPGFAGMREYIRRNTSRGWIINLTPEGKTPPAQNAIFNIGTPVSVALFVREPGNNPEVPADIKYVAFEGTRQQKFDQFEKLKLDSNVWQETRTGWGDKFTPKPLSAWDSYPAMQDIFLWQSPGIKPNKTWVYAPAAEVLEWRWAQLVSEEDSARKAEYFKETSSTSLTKVAKPLPGAGTEQNTNIPVNDEEWTSQPTIVRIGYRSFDRQYVIADSRLLHRPVPNLWAARIPGQVFINELHSEFPRKGPGIIVSPLIPDMHYFRGSGGGRSHPLFHPDGSYNFIDGVTEAITKILGKPSSPEDCFYYIIGISGHAGYVETFDSELKEGGNRVPLTRDQELWNTAVELGKQVVWLHTFGERGEAIPGISSIRNSTADYAVPVYEKSMGEMPESKPAWYSSYLLDDQEYANALVFGDAVWSGVEKEVFDYTVGGNNVLGSWAGYRLKDPNGKRTSPLNDIFQTKWPREWSVELTEILAVLTHLVHLEPQQEKLLQDVLASDLISVQDLQEAGVQFPASAKERKPKLA